MHGSPKFSVVIPVYNRPDELRELLSSLSVQTFTDFEVVVVEDGSALRSDAVVQAFSDQLRIQYLYKPNSGPGPSRNFGFQHARGDYFVVFDSDCLIPPHYFAVVDEALRKSPFDVWGGPDRGHPSFTAVQQAMAYTMSAPLTTGGIRGSGDEQAFLPRSFNMGLSRKVWEATGGFSFTHLAEDIELSMRIRKAGFRVVLLRDAYVFHKRRTTWAAFFRQVYNFGKGRVRVGRVHPEALRPIHFLPALFVVGSVLLLLSAVTFFPLFAAGMLVLIAYSALLFWKAYRFTARLDVALLAVPAALIQLTGYGSGFCVELMKSAHPEKR
jgi:glycosyltransferase involved in cell wall biosynthesis